MSCKHVKYSYVVDSLGKIECFEAGDETSLVNECNPVIECVFKVSLEVAAIFLRLELHAVLICRLDDLLLCKVVGGSCRLV